MFKESYVGCDFDGTLYRGNSAIDFFLFCMKKRENLRWFFFKHLGNYLKYLLGFHDFNRNTEKFYLFLQTLENIDALIEEFWDAHWHKLKNWFQALDSSRILILTAAPDFLMHRLVKRLDCAGYLGTYVDRRSGEVKGQACIGSEKLRRFKEAYGNCTLEAFYSDSRKDRPLAAIAKNAYKIKGEKVIPWLCEK